MTEDDVPEELEAKKPQSLSGQLEDLAQEQLMGSELQGKLEDATDAASALEADLMRARRNDERTTQENARLMTRTVELEAKIADLEARVFETDTWRTQAEEELDDAKLEAATLAAEVQRLEAESTPFGQRRAAWEAAAGERTQADTLQAVLTAAQWIADGSTDLRQENP